MKYHTGFFLYTYILWKMYNNVISWKIDSIVFETMPNFKGALILIQKICHGLIISPISLFSNNAKIQIENL